MQDSSPRPEISFMNSDPSTGTASGKKWRKAIFTVNAARRFRYAGGLHGAGASSPTPYSRSNSYSGKPRQTEITPQPPLLSHRESTLQSIQANSMKSVPCLSNGFGIEWKDLVDLLELPHELERVVEAGGVDRIAKCLLVDMDVGLPSEENHEELYEARAAAFGRNVYPEQPPKAFWEYCWDACQDSTLAILFACASAALATGMVIEGVETGWYDGVGIWFAIIAVVLTTAMNDYQQDQQFRELDKTNKDVRVSVLRGGVRKDISIFGVMVGDIVVLATGDQVCADGLVVSSQSMEVDESTMTGESDLLKKDRVLHPFMLSGTKVADGYGTMLVTGVGQSTEWGKLMAAGQDPEEAGSKLAKLEEMKEAGQIEDKEYQSQRRALEEEAQALGETPLQVRLNGLASNIGKLGMAVAVVVLVVLVIRWCLDEGYDEGPTKSARTLIEYFMIAVTIVVVAVPEGLPLAVTLSLAYSMKKMMNDNALVRHLAACETMGGATNICSDKTGTLTTNKMTVVRSWMMGAERAAEGKGGAHTAAALPALGLGVFFQSAFVNAEGEVYTKDEQGAPLEEPVVTGKPTEVALLNYGLQLGGSPEDAKRGVEVVKMDPFSSAKKRMGACIRTKDGGLRVLWKGASEIVLGLCTRKMNPDGSVTQLSERDQDELKALIGDMAQQSLRTLCFAYADLAPGHAPPGPETDIPENDLVCLAIVGIKDPCRPGVPDAVARCQRAGIVVRMVTGDNVVTASAIARECHILTPEGEAVEGQAFRKMSYAERIQRFGPRLERLQVMARSSPTDKYDLVHMLRGLGEVVGVTGDGTNDARALKEADIGLAMGIAGTEVAKKCSDIVILDDDFTSIVTVVRWGRSVYANIQKFVQFQITVNLVALSINFVSAVSDGHAPLTVVQLLWVNMIMDTMGALALATEPPREELMQQAPYGRTSPLITSVMWRNIIGQYIFQLVVLVVYLFEGDRIFGIDVVTGECVQPLGASWDDCDNWHKFSHNRLEEEEEKADLILNTIIFNTFVFFQIFNEMNARQMIKVNIFDGILENHIFVAVIVITAFLQTLMIEVKFLNDFVDTTPLDTNQWIACVAVAAISLPIGVLMKFIPFPDEDKIAEWQSNYLAVLTRETPKATDQLMAQLGDTEKELQQEKERVAELTRRINQMQHTLDDQNRELHFIKDKLIEIHVPGTSYSRLSIDSTCAGRMGTEHVNDAYAM